MKKLLIVVVIIIIAIAGWFIFRNFQDTSEPTATPMRTVKLFYYNPENDKDSTGNLQCTEQGLSPIEREIPITQTPIQDTIRLLLKGEINAKEHISGITTEFPLEGFVLMAASLRDEVLTLAFYDPSNRTSGGSCRVNILRAQVKATAKQFPGIKEVRFSPESLFQP